MNPMKQRHTLLHTALWIAQAILATGFVWAASMKLFQPADALAEIWPWTAEHRTLVILTGILDFFAGLGFVLPSLIRKVSGLTFYAALGTIALMIAASVFHIWRGEAEKIGINIFFALLATFVALKRRPSAQPGS